MYYVKPTLKNLSQGARLEYVRKLRYMSKDDVADYFELGGERKERTISRYENNSRVPSNERLKELKEDNKLVAAERLEQRTRYDLEMLEETGFCSGIENYSAPMAGRKKGETPVTLMDFFGDDYLLVVDESHVTIPQVRGMYNGDRSRKENLVNYGFRLPSALDNRPLKFNEFEESLSRQYFVCKA